MLIFIFSVGEITLPRMKFCVVCAISLIRLINCSPPDVTVSRLLVQFVLCMCSMIVHE